ncbi:hypothetical protein NAT51_15405 [Flavobacterium amniphilum]|uniref:hypothetical protein n=1 Tax=Flavobacterium amniphilum TaxID=1834035 RepID=UPI00202A156C|nr:hypothetical protein [Flavobacterium amniphilum]MCL9806922.1 hypothetical protein [Flavobacterium amniphilum]
MKLFFLILPVFVISCSDNGQKKSETNHNKPIKKDTAMVLKDTVVYTEHKPGKLNRMNPDRFLDVTDSRLKLIYKNDSLVDGAKINQRIYKVTPGYSMNGFDEEIMNVVLDLHEDSVVEALGMPKLADFKVLENFDRVVINKEEMRLLVLENNYSAFLPASPEFCKIVGIYIPYRRLLHVFYCSDFKIKKDGFVLIHHLRGNTFEVAYRYKEGDLFRVD